MTQTYKIPMMYDCSDDMEKPVTQEHLDMLQAAGEYNGIFRYIIRTIDVKVKSIGVPIDYILARDRLRKIRNFIDDLDK